MILFDVNVLLNAHRVEQPDHELARDLLQRTVSDARPYAVSELILGSFVRIATHRRALNPPTPLGDALDFCEGLRSRPNARIIAPGPRHWTLFTDLCRRVDAVGNLAPTRTWQRLRSSLAVSGSASTVTSRVFQSSTGAHPQTELQPKGR